MIQEYKDKFVLSAVVLAVAVISLMLSMVCPVQGADQMFVHDFGGGSFVATSDKTMGEWIVKFYYWLADVGLIDQECIEYGL